MSTSVPPAPSMRKPISRKVVFGIYFSFSLSSAAGFFLPGAGCSSARRSISWWHVSKLPFSSARWTCRRSRSFSCSRSSLCVGDICRLLPGQHQVLFEPGQAAALGPHLIHLAPVGDQGVHDLVGRVAQL